MRYGEHVTEAETVLDDLSTAPEQCEGCIGVLTSDLRSLASLFPRSVPSGPLATANKYRFSSKEWDDNAGLYYYLYRFYDPNLQRWVNRDPIQEWGRNVNLYQVGGINLYTYVDTDPLSEVDPLGLTGLPTSTWNRLQQRLACIARAARILEDDFDQAQKQLNSCLDTCNGPCPSLDDQCRIACMNTFHIEAAMAMTEYTAYALTCFALGGVYPRDPIAPPRY